MEMKRFGVLLSSILLGIGVITTSAFAYFNFSEHSTTSNDTKTQENYVNNIKFDNTTTIDREFNLYFFASPYYATGNPTNDSTTNTITWDDVKDQDPLDLCELGESNPYNNTDNYTLGGLSVDSAYANVSFTNNSHYYCIPDDAIDESKLDSNGKLTGEWNTFINYYQTRDFSGYITLYNTGNSGQRGTLIKDSDGNYVDIDSTKTKIYSYYKLTVKGGIKADVLKNIIPSSVFKDRYGFGPEFMGWTYNKEECFKRVAYQSSTDSSSYSRYFKTSNSDNQNIRLYHFDSRGYGVGNEENLAYQIGNYGDNKTITMFSADDSLIYINSLGVDGSSTSDNNIYLYPVFGSKNGIKNASGSQISIIKMRTNPITDTTSSDYYKYHQIGEIDYDEDRFTSYYNYDSNAVISNNEPNYTLKNFYVDQQKENDEYVNNYQLDINITSNGSWTSTWVTLIDSSTIHTLGFFDEYYATYQGYFDIDIIFEMTSTPSFTSLKNSELYINELNVVTTTIVSDNKTFNISYIVGIKRDNSLKITGLYDTGSIFMYDSSSKANSYLYKSSVTHKDDSDSSIWYYFSSNSIELSENQNISVMIQNALNLKDDHDLNSFTYMDSTRLDAYNTLLTSSSFITNKTKYQATISTSKLITQRGSITAYDPDNYPSTTIIENFPYINATEEGTYELLIAVNYSKGFPYNIEVGYREIATDNVLLVLDTLPEATSNGYLYSEIHEKYSSNIVCEGTFQKNTIITTDTSFQNNNKITISDTTQIIDLATGIDVTSLIKEGKFYSTRNIILYYKTK